MFDFLPHPKMISTFDNSSGVDFDPVNPQLFSIIVTPTFILIGIYAFIEYIRYRNSDDLYCCIISFFLSIYFYFTGFG